MTHTILPPGYPVLLPSLSLDIDVIGTPLTPFVANSKPDFPFVLADPSLASGTEKYYTALLDGHFPLLCDSKLELQKQAAGQHEKSFGASRTSTLCKL